MILSDLEIWMEIGSERLKFSPNILPEQVTPSAIDLRLGHQFTIFREATQGVETVIDPTQIGNVEDILNIYGEQQTIASEPVP